MLCSPHYFLLLTPQLLQVDNLDGESGKTGSFVMEVHPDWAPLGAARMKTLVDEQFFSGVRFFRVINNFMAQFGISGDPKVAAKWRNEKMVDDPVKESNTRGFVSFATSGKNSRTTQVCSFSAPRFSASRFPLTQACRISLSDVHQLPR